MTKRRITISITGLLAGLAGAYMLLHSPATPAQTAPSSLPVVNTVTVQGYTLVRERKISRTVSDLTYRVSVRNTGPALIVVTGTASTAATNVTFLDSGVTLGDIASGTPATSTDTFTIRQNRSRPFRTSQLIWQFRAAPGEGIPPDPGPANDQTLAGIDSDNDGVRDDVERYIATEYPDSARMRSMAMQAARATQMTLTASTDSAISAASLANRRAGTCAFLTDADQSGALLRKLEVAVVNTLPRMSALDSYEQRIAGTSGGAQKGLPSIDNCDVLPSSLPN